MIRKRVILKRVVRNIGVYFLFGVITVIALFPIYWAFVSSFKSEGEIYKYPPTWFPLKPTLEGYIRVFTETLIPRQFLNSVSITAWVIVTVLVVSILAGYSFSRADFRWKTILMFAILGTQMISGLGNVVALYFLAARLKLLNTHLVLIIIYSAGATPFAIWFMKAFFDGIPKTLEDAAFIDGCSRLQALYKIIVPLCKPALVAASLFVFASVWNEFFLAFIMISRNYKTTLPVGIFTFIGVQDGQVEANALSAVAIIGLVPIVILFLILRRHFISGITAGAVKG